MKSAPASPLASPSPDRGSERIVASPLAPPQPQPQPLWFLVLLVLAVAGGAVAYVPFLTVLLPARIAELAGTSDVAALSAMTFAGALAASLAHIAFGWLSDITRRRRGWILAGMALTTSLFLLFDRMESVRQLLLLIIAWQAALNMMLAPLLAWTGDCVPDSQKGLLGGMLSLAPALGALAGVLVTWPGLFPAIPRSLVLSLLVAGLVLPSLIVGGGRARAALMRPSLREDSQRRSWPGAAPWRMWAARLLVQSAEASLFAFLFFWLLSLEGGFDEAGAARLFSVAVLVAVPLSLWLGRWSDRRARPFAPLAASAAVASLALAGMALAPDARLATGAYVLFAIGSMVFLALHQGQTLRVLPRPERRGRDLGLFNLTNTIPSLIVPWLALALVPALGFAGLFLLLAILVALAALLLAGLAERDE